MGTEDQHICGVKDCPFQGERNTIATGLEQIRLDIAIIKNNFIKLEDYLRLKNQVEQIAEQAKKAVDPTEFKLVRIICFGAAGAILLGFIGVLVKYAMPHS